MRVSRTLRLAHRGDWRVAPENSLAAMRAALANPACDGLEFDVRGSRDGTPILLHDTTLARVQGRPERPEELSVAELAAVGIPTLADVLGLAGPEPFLDVELKGEPVPDIVPVLESFRGPALRRTVVSSFEVETLRWLAGLRPDWPRWLNAAELTPATIRLASELGCRGLSVGWRSITAAGLKAATSATLELAVWTVRRQSTAARLERLGVIGMCVEASALDG